MSIKKTRKVTTESLEAQIGRILAYMAEQNVDSAEYKTASDQLEQLYKIQGPVKSSPLSKDAILAAGASILGIIVIVAYEHGHVIGSKGLSFVTKTRI